MTKLRFLTAGESHGPALSVVLEGIPSGLELLAEDINKHLSRRQKGYGRGARMKIETDQIKFLSGVRHGYTLGSPIGLQIQNQDYINWDIVMNPAPVDISDSEVKEAIAAKFLSRVRPGHADFAGAIKYKHSDVRNILERSSARETTSRVALGAIALKFLEAFGIKIYSQVLRVGSVELPKALWGNITAEKFAQVEASEMRCCDPKTTTAMKAEIDMARTKGESLGGVIELIAEGLPIGLGSHIQWDKRLDGLIAQALMSVHTAKAVSFGIGSEAGILAGSLVHDEIQLSESENNSSNYAHLTNSAGGIEGGMTNGEPIICQVVLKPIPTLARKPENSLKSIDLATKQNDIAFYERSDVCVVPAGGVVCEAMLALVLANEILNKFGGDSMDEALANYKNYLSYCKSR